MEGQQHLSPTITKPTTTNNNNNNNNNSNAQYDLSSPTLSTTNQTLSSPRATSINTTDTTTNEPVMTATMNVQQPKSKKSTFSSLLKSPLPLTSPKITTSSGGSGSGSGSGGVDKTTGKKLWGKLKKSLEATNRLMAIAKLVENDDDKKKNDNQEDKLENHIGEIKIKSPVLKDTDSSTGEAVKKGNNSDNNNKDDDNKKWNLASGLGLSTQGKHESMKSGLMTNAEDFSNNPDVVPIIIEDEDDDEEEEEDDNAFTKPKEIKANDGENNNGIMVMDEFASFNSDLFKSKGEDEFASLAANRGMTTTKATTTTATAATTTTAILDEPKDSFQAVGTTGKAAELNAFALFSGEHDESNVVTTLGQQQEEKEEKDESSALENPQVVPSTDQKQLELTTVSLDGERLPGLQEEEEEEEEEASEESSSSSSDDDNDETNKDPTQPVSTTQPNNLDDAETSDSESDSDAELAMQCVQLNLGRSGSQVVDDIGISMHGMARTRRSNTKMEVHQIDKIQEHYSNEQDFEAKKETTPTKDFPNETFKSPERLLAEWEQEAGVAPEMSPEEIMPQRDKRQSIKNRSIVMAALDASLESDTKLVKKRDELSASKHIKATWKGIKGGLREKLSKEGSKWNLTGGLTKKDKPVSDYGLMGSITSFAYDTVDDQSKVGSVDGDSMSLSNHLPKQPTIPGSNDANGENNSESLQQKLVVRKPLRLSKKAEDDIEVEDSNAIAPMIWARKTHKFTLHDSRSIGSSDLPPKSVSSEPRPEDETDTSDSDTELALQCVQLNLGRSGSKVVEDIGISMHGMAKAQRDSQSRKDRMSVHHIEDVAEEYSNEKHFEAAVVVTADTSTTSNSESKLRRRHRGKPSSSKDDDKKAGSRRSSDSNSRRRQRGQSRRSQIAGSARKSENEDTSREFSDSTTRDGSRGSRKSRGSERDKIDADNGDLDRSTREKRRRKLRSSGSDVQKSPTQSRQRRSVAGRSSTGTRTRASSEGQDVGSPRGKRSSKWTAVKGSVDFVNGTKSRAESRGGRHRRSRGSERSLKPTMNDSSKSPKTSSKSPTRVNMIAKTPTGQTESITLSEESTTPTTAAETDNSTDIMDSGELPRFEDASMEHDEKPPAAESKSKKSTVSLSKSPLPFGSPTTPSGVDKTTGKKLWGKLKKSLEATNRLMAIAKISEGSNEDKLENHIGELKSPVLKDKDSTGEAVKKGNNMWNLASGLGLSTHGKRESMKSGLMTNAEDFSKNALESVSETFDVPEEEDDDPKPKDMKAKVGENNNEMMMDEFASFNSDLFNSTGEDEFASLAANRASKDQVDPFMT